MSSKNNSPIKNIISSGVKEVKYLLDYKNNKLCKEMACDNNIRLIKLIYIYI